MNKLIAEDSPILFYLPFPIQTATGSLKIVTFSMPRSIYDNSLQIAKDTFCYGTAHAHHRGQVAALRNTGHHSPTLSSCASRIMSPSATVLPKGFSISTPDLFLALLRPFHREEQSVCK